MQYLEIAGISATHTHTHTPGAIYARSRNVRSLSEIANSRFSRDCYTLLAECIRETSATLRLK